MTDVKAVHRRYQAYAGFVTTPQYFDDSPQQFLQVAPKGTGILQRVNHIPDYAYELGQRAKNFDLLEESAICLGRSFCQAIGQVGTNWVHCNGTSPDDIVRICDEISERAGARFFMAGQCIVDGLLEIGAKRITVANGYFREDWSRGINTYLEAAGFEVLWAGDTIDQGIVASHEEKLRIEAETLWDYPNHIMIAAAIDAHERAPLADAIVQTGAGFRMLQVVDTIEGRTGKPVVGSDFALYWAMLKHLGLPAAPGHGHLLSTLS
jgi:maleate cis-trans isomerase